MFYCKFKLQFWNDTVFIFNFFKTPSVKVRQKPVIFLNKMSL